jgi:hypothetical protein
MIVINPMTIVITIIFIRKSGCVSSSNISSPSIISFSILEKDDTSRKMLSNHGFRGKNLEIPLALVQLMIVINPKAMFITIILIRISACVSSDSILSPMKVLLRFSR